MMFVILEDGYHFITVMTVFDVQYYEKQSSPEAVRVFEKKSSPEAVMTVFDVQRYKKQSSPEAVMTVGLFDMQ